MKHQNISKKLSFNKETISNLNHQLMMNARGGADKETLLFMSEPDSTCFSVMACSQFSCPTAECTKPSACCGPIQ